MNLKDLAAGENIDDILQTKEVLKPFSSRVKLVIEYNDETKLYELSTQDAAVLAEYIELEEF